MFIQSKYGGLENDCFKSSMLIEDYIRTSSLMRNTLAMKWVGSDMVVEKYKCISFSHVTRTYIRSYIAGWLADRTPTSSDPQISKKSNTIGLSDI